MLCDLALGQAEAFSKPEICKRLVAAQCGLLDRASPSSYAASIFGTHLSQLKERKAAAFEAYLAGACGLAEGGFAMLNLLGKYSRERSSEGLWPDCRGKLLQVYSDRVLGAPKRLAGLAYGAFDDLLASLTPEVAS